MSVKFIAVLELFELLLKTGIAVSKAWPLPMTKIDDVCELVKTVCSSTMVDEQDGPWLRAHRDQLTPTLTHNS
jgi:hypothetical protein